MNHLKLQHQKTNHSVAHDVSMVGSCVLADPDYMANVPESRERYLPFQFLSVEE